MSCFSIKLPASRKPTSCAAQTAATDCETTGRPHVNERQAGMRTFRHALVPKDRVLNFEAVGQYRDDDFDAAGHIAAACVALHAVAHGRVKKRGNNVVSHELMAGLPRLRSTGFPIMPRPIIHRSSSLSFTSTEGT